MWKLSRGTAASDNESSFGRVQPWQVATLIVWSAAMLWLSWRSGIQHDQRAYVKQWQLVLDGVDPWSTDNAYGPLFAVLGFLMPIGPMAPKIFMVTSLLIANAALVLALIRERVAGRSYIVYLLAVPLNVLFVGVGVIYGLNDAFVAALLVFAVLLRLRGYFLSVGVLVGLAALVKFYPLLLLPFFALDDGRLRWSTLVAGVAMFGAGLLAAVAVWGFAPISPMLFGVNRGPWLLSILRSLKKTFGDQGPVGWLIRYNSYFVIAGVAASFMFAWKMKLIWLEGVILAYLVMLALYKVGNQQFYLPWLLLVASLPLLKRQSADRMAIVLLPFILLLSLYQLGYQFASYRYKDHFVWVSFYGPFIVFAISAASVAAHVAIARSPTIRAKAKAEALPPS